MRYFLVPSLISFTYFYSTYSTYSIKICFYSYRRFISAQEGLFAGVKLKQREIKSIIPGENLSFDKIGLRVESNKGTSRINTL